MTYEDFLQHFSVKTRNSGKAQCICPAHDDKQASLTITATQDRILIHCHAGCSCGAILDAVGLKQSDLFFEDREPTVEVWRQYVESREKKKIEAVYNYVLIDGGGYAFTKIRMTGKKMIYGRLDGNRFLYGLGAGGRKKYAAVYAPQGIKALHQAIADGTPIFLPEGEKDADTLTLKGYAAVTVGGASDWRKSYSAMLKGANVFILADNDAPGIGLATQEAEDIGKVAASVRVVVPCPDIKKGDISDYFAAGHTREEFEKLIYQNVEEEPLRESIPFKSDSLIQKLERLDACNNFPSNDLGGSALFAEVFKEQCRYSPTIKDWMFYDGVKWRRDYEGMAARNSCKRLADAILQYAIHCPLDDKKKTDYLKYAVSLANANRRNTIVNDSRDVNCFTSEEMDVNDHLLNVQNGTLDLSGDKPIFRHHNADDLLSKACGVNYEPGAKCPLWKKTLSEIFEDDAGKINYIQKLFGYVLTGETKEEQMYFLYGSTSRNGKSTITETVLYILGDYGQTISPETLAIKANRDSRNASPDIAKLAGARLVIASEPPKRMLFDSALVKTLTGRDRISARFLHENEFSYTPRFKLILNTNYLPTISDQTIFMSGRIKVIEFNRHFSDAEQDKTLKEKLREEAPGILNWMIEGYEKYKTDGLTPPESVIVATQNYATDSDKMQRFINERLIESEHNSGAGAVYKVYGEWCKASGYGVESKSNFFSDLKAKGIFRDRGTVNGVTAKNIIVGYEVDEFEVVEPDEITPFQ